MGWSGVEVESVELVQDMSYEKLKERMDRAIQKGNDSIIVELNNNFEIAVKAVEKKRGNVNGCIMQCDESFIIIVLNLFLALGIIRDNLGYTAFVQGMLEEIQAECKKDRNNRDLKKMAQKCDEMLENYSKTIEILGGDIKSAELLRRLANNKVGNSFFKNFVDSIMRLVGWAEEIVASNKKYEDTAIKAIYLYVNSEWERMCSTREKPLERKIHQGLCLALDLYNSKYNRSILTTPFSHTLNILSEA